MYDETVLVDDVGVTAVLYEQLSTLHFGTARDAQS